MKKRVFYVGLALVLAAYCALTTFAFAQSAEEAAAEPITVEGAWQAVAYVAKDQVSLIDQETMVFTADEAADYRGGAEEPYVRSAYTIADNKLTLSDINVSYMLDALSGNILCLYSTPDTHTVLVRVAEDAQESGFAQELLAGDWDVVYRPGIEQLNGEILSFDDENLSDYRNGDTNPAAVVPYEWDENGNLVVPKLAKVFRMAALDDGTIYFIESDTGYAWELHRIK